MQNAVYFAIFCLAISVKAQSNYGNYGNPSNQYNYNQTQYGGASAPGYGSYQPLNSGHQGSPSNQYNQSQYGRPSIPTYGSAPQLNPGYQEYSGSYNNSRPTFNSYDQTRPGSQGGFGSPNYWNQTSGSTPYNPNQPLYPGSNQNVYPGGIKTQNRATPPYNPPWNPYNQTRPGISNYPGYNSSIPSNSGNNYGGRLNYTQPGYSQYPQQQNSTYPGRPTNPVYPGSTNPALGRPQSGYPSPSGQPFTPGGSYNPYNSSYPGRAGGIPYSPYNNNQTGSSFNNPSAGQPYSPQTGSGGNYPSGGINTRFPSNPNPNNPNYGGTSNYGSQNGYATPTPYDMSYSNQGSGYNSPTGQQSQQLIDCLAKCQRIGSSGPVCGTNQRTYPNLSALQCEQSCGAGVQYSHSGSC